MYAPSLLSSPALLPHWGGIRLAPAWGTFLAVKASQDKACVCNCHLVLISFSWCVHSVLSNSLQLPGVSRTLGDTRLPRDLGRFIFLTPHPKHNAQLRGVSFKMTIWGQPTKDIKYSLWPHQAPLSMGFSRQEYWHILPCPPPEDLLDPGIKHSSLAPSALIGKFFSTNSRISFQVPSTPTYTCGPWNQWNRQQQLISTLKGQVVTVRMMLAELKELISKWSSCCHLWPSPTLEGTLPWAPDVSSRVSSPHGFSVFHRWW